MIDLHVLEATLNSSLHCFKTWSPISQFSHDHIEFLHEYHIGYHLLLFMLHHNLLRGTPNSSLELLAWRLDQQWLNIWDHHNLNFNPYIEFSSLTILSSSWSFISQLISASMTIFDFFHWTPPWSHLVHHMNFILIILESIT